MDSSLTVKIPEGVRIECGRRVVRVSGPRGQLVKSFKHANVELKSKADAIVVTTWFNNNAQLALLRTVASHIQNMITGVTKGYRYKLRCAAAHFNIVSTINEKERTVELRHFLGEKMVRVVKLQNGVTATRDPNSKDGIVLEGNDIAAVSQTAASIQQCTRVRNKDLRKFLDGAYVQERGPIPDEE
ncbi:Ribosomal protein L6 [Carpediemonas membranifera]|uniref:Ribosomal protein L6 n=1 Tax=Carpediemonas membranifera TaxID=201153 RepID=A0A8J6B2Y6_9EUKA|nr:Ribosomal protein L6 [Carpediemonas membranifera]|eukprot:KAG9393154.1 Ribosomal protein L6 [Carpediemonas membranifera]